MAKAPRPGVGKRIEAVKQAQKVWVITIRDESYSCAFNNLPFSERTIVRQSTGGMPIGAYVNGVIDDDSLQVLWWVARRANGEANLSLGQVLAEWPEDLMVSEVRVQLDDGIQDDEDADPQS